MADGCCEREIDALKQEFANLQLKIKDKKQEYHKLLIENLEKDLLIRKKKQNTKKFLKFEGRLSMQCIDTLNSIGSSQRQDSQFIYVALNDLYSNNIDELKNISLSGQSKEGNKSKIPESTKKLLEELLAERMEHLQSTDYSRNNNLAKLIRNAIDKANKAKGKN